MVVLVTFTRPNVLEAIVKIEKVLNEIENARG